HRVIEIATDELDQDEALRVAAAVESDSEHPVARAILTSAMERELAVPGAQDFRALPGHGGEAQVEGPTWGVGGPELARPVARAILTSAMQRELAVPGSQDFRALPGHGVEAQVDGRTWRVGGPNLLRQLGVAPPPLIADAADRFAERGQSSVYLIDDTEVR